MPPSDATLCRVFGEKESTPTKTFCLFFSGNQGGVDSLLRVTPSELAKHNTREDCWQVYAGRVYNVGPFLRYHPGGVGEMMRGAGKDGEFRSFVGSFRVPRRASGS